MPKKKSPPQPKKKTPEKRGLLEQFLQVLDRVFSYFEVLFIYLRKYLNQGIRETIGFVLLIIYSLYLELLKVFQENPSLASLSLGLGLFLISGILIATLLRRISI